MIVEPCVFCDIVHGRRSAHVAYGTTAVLAFLDQFRQPRDAAHVLVIPRAHVESIYGIDDELGAELFSAHVLIARAVKRAFGPDGVTTWSSNERGADQEVPHYHLHVYPRWVGVRFPPATQRPDVAVADEILSGSEERIRGAVAEMRPGAARATA